ncbi:hypothetical protein F441_10400 [Phytophthora nicotianae CJ01A1]|uniref:Uncharacterized protein n=4 Tax=Phytophthora nicotianae TaxID=4792 RepID=W2R989_PHYN3|nr:hypothetical protein PPTG_21139 [Phytophthora nicotianae INRA-310]ETK84859.1 hypothetical protein L915_10218 [Phytophthora nicotianae]ETN21776.1 hypothetical protein PPTG_21139 [Phytophthora nicotianae INRA-310]ETO73503.1 hypothetical protein F444_10553 [Phytophthora nicotianae P1976]ETP14680.1 hypothetical protein F441_10400 [Phytophthora nicotianae CJ01A1]
MPHFTEADFVLAAQVLSRANKLAVQWKGIKRIVKVTFSRFKPFELSTHHASRLKFYADASRDVTEDLIAQAMHAEGGHSVSILSSVELVPSHILGNPS